MQHSSWAGAFSLVAAAPVAVELFTSQGCSSCPRTDGLLAEPARTRQDVQPPSLHMTCWDRLGWNDPFPPPDATERQRRILGTPMLAVH